MHLASLFQRCALVALTCLLVVLQPGCGGGSSGKVNAGPLKDRDAIAAALPQGVSLESAVVPDVLYGEAKTVEDALASLQAYVRGQTIFDGGLGHEIRFEHGGKGSTESKSPKKKQQAKVPYTVIMLAN
jgi:hypothetical protein